MPEPQVRDLLSNFGSEGDFEHLLDYGAIRYHLLLSYNVNRDCPENNALNQLYAAVSNGDQDAVSEAVDTCLGVLWPFVLSDFSARIDSESENIIRLQALSIDGVLCARNHDHHLEYPPTKPITNTFPTVPVYKPGAVERLKEISMHIFKVRVRDSIYCMKSIHRTGRETDFARELETLSQCSHPNIIALVGLVEAPESDKVEGILLHFVDDARVIRNVEQLSATDCEKWTVQITGAVRYLHEKGLVWGDAKPSNVLIDKNDNAVVVDFGGGYTEGWVDEANQETVRGDLQGLARIVSYMRMKCDAAPEGSTTWPRAQIDP